MEEDLQGLLNKAYFYLKFRPRTVAEMRRYLYKKVEKTHWSRVDADKVIDHLITEGLLDDKQFIQLFVEQRKNLKPKGAYVLKQELLRYGASKDLIDEYFSNNPIDEENLAEKVLAGRWTRFKNLSPEQRFQKTSQFLLRRGFKFEIIKKLIANLIEKE